MEDCDPCLNSYLICRWSRHHNQIHLCKHINFDYTIYLLTNILSLSVDYKVNLNLFRPPYKILHNPAAIFHHPHYHDLQYSIHIVLGGHSGYGLCITCQTYITCLTAKSSSISFPLLYFFLPSFTSSLRTCCIFQGSTHGVPILQSLKLKVLALSFSLLPSLFWAPVNVTYHALVLLADSRWNDLTMKRKDIWTMASYSQKQKFGQAWSRQVKRQPRPSSANL